MERIYFDPQKDGFYGAYYRCPQPGSAAIIAMLGDSIDDYMARGGVWWLHQQGVHVLTMSPAPKNYSHHDLPLERFGAAIAWLQGQGIRRIGVLGASTTGMLALIAASYYPQLTLTIGLSPSDFVMEGFYQENGVERPGDHESTVSWQGQPLPYLPFCYRHPQYWQELKQEAKSGGNMIASREMFNRSELLHPIQEEEYIRAENIHGTVVLVGAEDDCLWDTCRYIRRMQHRLEGLPHDCRCIPLLYEHGTHFVFPQRMLTHLLPVGSGLLVRAAFRAGRQFPKECLAARQDIDRRISGIIREWSAGV